MIKIFQNAYYQQYQAKQSRKSANQTSLFICILSNTFLKYCKKILLMCKFMCNMSHFKKSSKVAHLPDS